MKKTLITIAMASLLVSGCVSNNEVVSKTDIKQNDFIKESALHDAVRAKDLAMVELLVSKKINVNSKNIEGYTPLHLAVRLKEYDITSFLIENGAAVNTFDKYSETPLLDSTKDNYTEISKLLLCNGAKRNVSDKNEMTPLHNSSKNKNDVISSMLLSDNLDPFCKEEVVLKKEEVVETPKKKETNNVVFKGLYDALMEEFQDDFDVWDATLTKEDLVFRFSNPMALYDTGKSDLKVGFTDILSDFFPRYLNILDQYKDKIEEIRIEGHTSSEYVGAKTEEQKYTLNKKLSEIRAKKVRDYVVTDGLKSSAIDKEWTENKFKNYGMSSDNLILNPDETENKIASRRVEFKIMQVEK